jgi:hypothetical protein
MITKFDVFISYFHEDLKYVEKIRNNLANKRISICYDKNMNKGTLILEEIEENIKGSSVFLLIISKRSNLSSWLAPEIYIAKSNRLVILPLFIDDIDPPPFIKNIISNVNCIRAFENNFSQTIEQIEEIVLYAKDRNYVVINSNDFLEKGDEKKMKQITKQAIEIDKEYYGKYAGREKICQSWYKKNPNIYTLLFTQKSERLIGYINAMPLYDEYYQKIKNGTQIDTFINPKGICDYGLPGFYNLYFCSIAIKTAYCNDLSAFRILFNGFIKKIQDFAMQNIYFKEIVADSWTEKGDQMAKMLGMNYVKKTTHGSNIYSMSLISPNSILKSKKIENIINIYNKAIANGIKID